MRPADLPSAERYPHGTRARYVAGCRCAECRESNRLAYHVRQRKAKELAAEITTPAAPSPQVWTTPSGEKRVRVYARACPGVNGAPCATGSHLRKDSKGGVCGRCRLKLDWNGLVDAAPARRHVLRLARQGVGYRQVADAAGVSVTVTAKIKAGSKKTIRAETERKILGVDAGARADRATVPAAGSWKMLDRLLELGFTRSELARRLGSKSATPALQVSRGRVLVKTAQRIKRLYRELLAELDDERVCPKCESSHRQQDRLARLRRCPAATVADLRNWWPCTYPDAASARRDLDELGRA